MMGKCSGIIFRSLWLDFEAYPNVNLIYHRTPISILFGIYVTVFITLSSCFVLDRHYFKKPISRTELTFGHNIVTDDRDSRSDSKFGYIHLLLTEKHFLEKLEIETRQNFGQKSKFGKKSKLWP